MEEDKIDYELLKVLFRPPFYWKYLEIFYGKEKRIYNGN